MEDIRFYHPIAVRYGDVDAQRHVNNSRYFTYMEEARIQYVKHLGLWKSNNYDDIGFILVEASCTFKIPIRYGQLINAGVKTVRLGAKSMELSNVLVDAETGEEFALGRAVLVTYDYSKEESIPIPDLWRTTIQEFEEIT